jgi:hypothetical protein
MNELLKGSISWFWRHERHIVYIGGMIMFGAICFVFGIFTSAGVFSQDQLIVHQPIHEPITLPCTYDERGVSQEEMSTNVTCKYVGSIKGSKYYPPSCAYAKNIKEENLRCFSSAKDAQEKGYTPSESCK